MTKLQIPEEERSDFLDSLAALAEVALEAYFAAQAEQKSHKKAAAAKNRTQHNST